MLEQELSRIWQNASEKEIVKFNLSRLLIDMNTKLDEVDRKIRNRNLREKIGASIVIVCMGIYIFSCPGLLAKIASAMGVVYAIVVVYSLNHVRKYKVSSLGLPIREYLKKHKEYLTKERSLHDNNLYWYSLPPFIICSIFFFDVANNTTVFLVCLLLTTIVCAFSYWYYKRAVKKRFDPLIEEIDKSISELENTH